MSKQTEYFDKDFLDSKINVGDEVIFQDLDYREFVIGKVITKAPKSCQIEYTALSGYKRGSKCISRQCYGQVIKHNMCWKLVSEQPPEDGQYCIIYTKIHFTPDHVDEPDYYWGMELSRYYKDFGFSSANGLYAKYWMPQPEPPKDANKILY